MSTQFPPPWTTFPTAVYGHLLGLQQDIATLNTKLDALHATIHTSQHSLGVRLRNTELLLQQMQTDFAQGREQLQSLETRVTALEETSKNHSNSR